MVVHAPKAVGTLALVHAFYVAFAGVLGAIVGSFLNVVIYREGLRIGEQLAVEAGEPAPSARLASDQLGRRSVCPACGAPIPARLNIPILGWLALRGRAACCGAAISVRYPLVEALTAGLFAALLLADTPARVYQPSDAASPLAFALLFGFHAYFVANLIANTFIDFDHQILPDKLTRPLLFIGLLGGAVFGASFAGGLDIEPFGGRFGEVLGGLAASGLGAAVGWGATWAIRTVGTRVFGQEAMGLGDVKLMAGIGAFVGWPGALLTFFIGSIAGAFFGVCGRFVGLDTNRIAFGPYLALGAVVTLYGGSGLMHFATRTLPAWQAKVMADPLTSFVVMGVCVVLLVLVVWRGRSRRIEES